VVVQNDVDVHAAAAADDDDMGPMTMDPPHDLFRIDDNENDDACGHLHFVFYSFRPGFQYHRINPSRIMGT